MKKGLLGLLVIALTVVGCQNYDDQFDDLNKKILNLATDVSTLTGLQTTVATLGTKLDALASSSLTDADLSSILGEVADVQTAVDAIDTSGIESEVDSLNSEVDLILERLKDILAANAFYEGNLTITNLGQLANAHEMIKTGVDDPSITVKGNVLVTVSTANVLKDSIASVNLILAKLRTIQGTATVTTEVNADLPVLQYVTGNVDLNGKSGKAIITAPRLLTIDGGMEITGITGVISYPALGSVTEIILNEEAGKVTITSLDFSGMTTGKVRTGTDSLVLAKALSVKLGGALPSLVNLAKCTEFVHSTGGTQGALDLILGGTAATMSLNSTKFTGIVTITTKGSIFLPSLAETTAKLSLILGTAASEAHLPALTKVGGHLDISAKATTIDLGLLKTLTASLSIHGVVAIALPELVTAKSGSGVTTITCPVATSFIAPKLGTASRVIDLKSAVDHISILNIADAATPANDIVEWAALKKLTVAAQEGNLSVASSTILETLEFTGKQKTPAGEDIQNNSLTITNANTKLKTLTMGATSYLGTLTVTGSVIVTLNTAGAIINTNVINNSSLTTFGFAHTHVQGDRESRVDITNNTKVTGVDMSSLSKVGTVTVTGNVLLTSLVAPSATVLATSLATVTVFVGGNKLSGTYKRATAPTGTVTYVAPIITSPALASFKTWIQANVALDIANPIGGSTSALQLANRDRTHAAAGDVTYAQNTATLLTHGGVTANGVIFNMDIDKIDIVGTATVETGLLSAEMNGAGGAPAIAGATATAADNDGDAAGGVTSHRELATVAAQ